MKQLIYSLITLILVACADGTEIERGARSQPDTGMGVYTPPSTNFMMANSKLPDITSTRPVL